MLTLPPADHPLWKILQSLICLIGLAILVTHGVDGGHVGVGLDPEDGAGAIGLLAGGNLLRTLLKGLGS